MELTGYDVTLRPTGVHKITLYCIGSENDLETIRKVYYNPGLYQVIGLSRIEAAAYDRGYERGRRVGFSEGSSTHAGFTWNNPDLKIKKVIFNDPATIVFWADGTKTVAKAHGDDKFDKEVGLTVCIAKKALGNRSNFDKVFKKWIK